jgi:hypothetical protein
LPSWARSYRFSQIKIQIQFKHVHARLAEKSKRAAFGVLIYQLSQRGFRQATFARDA